MPLPSFCWLLETPSVSWLTDLIGSPPLSSHSFLLHVPLCPLLFFIRTLATRLTAPTYPNMRSSRLYLDVTTLCPAVASADECPLPGALCIMWGSPVLCRAQGNTLPWLPASPLHFSLKPASCSCGLWPGLGWIEWEAGRTRDAVGRTLRQGLNPCAA